MKNIIICTHYNEIQGLTDIFLDYCLSNKEIENIILLRNPLPGRTKLKSQIIVYKNSNKIDEIDFSSLSYFQFAAVWILNLYYLKKITAKYKIDRFDYYFAFDPLEYFYLFFYRFFLKISKKIFYSSDYADKRFDNKFLNFIYKLIDRSSLRDCDLYAAPSEVILQIRKTQGKNENQLYLAPHSFNKKNAIVKNIKERIPFSMVFIGNIKKPSVDLKYIFDGIADLKKIKYPEIKLYIFGDGDLVPEYKEYVAGLDIADAVLFSGVKPHDELFRELGKYWIGLCPYTVGPKIQGWHTAYCSLFTTKMIEYIANGTPFLTTALHDNVNLFEEWKVGRVMAPEKRSFMQQVKFFFSDMAKLDEYSNSCYEKSKDYSSEIVYGGLFEKIEN